MRIVKLNLIKTLSVLAIMAATAIATKAQPVTLSGTNYFQDFDGIGGGLPNEWLVYTNAKSSQLGTLVSFVNNPADTLNGWANTSFAFKNLASTNDTVGGTNFLGTEPIATQSNTLNRALSVRGTGAAGVEPTANNGGCAFVLKVANTIGFGKFKLDVDFLLLNPQTRSNYWAVDFGVSPDGSSPPNGFTTVTTNAFFALGTFGATHKTIDFGTLLDNQPGPIWIRIVNLTPSLGSGSRPTVGIDNYSLGFTNVAVVVNPPVITSSPLSASIFIGDTYNLTVGNSGTAPFTYQWYHPDLNSPIGGANSATYSIVNASGSDAGNYYVIVSNAAGSATNSPPAAITVGTRTPIPTTIFNLRTNQDAINWAPIDTTNFYTVTGVVITRTNMTTSGNSSFYIEDTNSLCGIDVFIGGDTTTRPAYGDTVQVTGPIGQFNGVLEFNLSSSNPTHIVNNLGPSGYVVPPKLIPFTAVSSPGLMETNYEGSLVVVSNITFQSGGIPGSNFLSGVTMNITNQSGQTFVVFIDARLGDIIGQPIPVGATSLTGYISQFKSSAPFTNGYQLVPTYLGAIVTSVNPIPLSFSSLPGSFTLSWADASFALQMSTNVAGPYTTISGAVSPFTTNTIDNAQMFFRLQHP